MLIEMHVLSNPKSSVASGSCSLISWELGRLRSVQRCRKKLSAKLRVTRGRK